jgi:hypothetical protein
MPVFISLFTAVNKLIKPGVVCDWFDTYTCELSDFYPKDGGCVFLLNDILLPEHSVS